MELVYLHKHEKELLNTEVTLQGWIKNHRKQKEFGFIDFYDGTSFKSIQLVYNDTLDSFDEIQKIRVGSSIEVKGILIESEGKGQSYEILLY